MQVGMFLNVLTVHVLLYRGRRGFFSPDTCAAGVAPRGDELALVMRFCVRLLLKRRATTQKP